MKLKRLLFGLLAVLISGAALAQTVLLPNITGTNNQDQNSIDFVGILRVNRTDTLTATASGTLANSTVLSRGMNVASTVASTNDSFTLPTLTGSVQIIVQNGGANTLRVWPNSATAQIDTGGAGTSKTVAANKMAIFTQGADNLWYSLTSP